LSHSRKPLHVRAALVAVPLLLLLCAAMWLTVRHYGAQAALETTQRMNLGLARYIVDHRTAGLIDAAGRPDRVQMKELAQQVMMINPAVEVYLLDRKGQVLAHALDGLTGPDPVGHIVDLAPVHSLVAGGDSLRLPMFGDDPRREGQRTVVSAAPVRAGAREVGFLYIVLDGQGQRGVSASLANSESQREITAALLLVTAMAAGIFVLALRKLTRPLRELAAEVESFRGEPAAVGDRPAGDEIDVLRAAVQAQQQRIAEQFRRLEEGDRQRRELVSSISHDLRTPLSNIRGYVETVLLRGDGLDVEARTQHLGTALRHAELLGRRIRDLFELSKLDAGRVEPQAEVFCLAELLQDVVQNYQLAAQQRGVRLALAEDSHNQAPVSADIALIERVLQNLVDNALRYTAAGGEVTLSVCARGRQFEISVADTGRGIAQEHLPHIFERYWRAGDAEESQPGTSAGLGLAIVKRILDLHGSVVRVQSELRRGTRIEFSLPQVV
jgi:signal transduction histidine kinase